MTWSERVSCYNISSIDPDNLYWKKNDDLIQSVLRWCEKVSCYNILQDFIQKIIDFCLSVDQRVEPLIIFNDSQLANKKEIVNDLRSSGSNRPEESFHVSFWSTSWTSFLLSSSFTSLDFKKYSLLYTVCMAMDAHCIWVPMLGIERIPPWSGVEINI